ncbi:hypothetical protein M8C21_030148, partial [Ambrosia artemisiifolia]
MMSMKEPLDCKHPTAWIEFEKGLIDEGYNREKKEMTIMATVAQNERRRLYCTFSFSCFVIYSWDVMELIAFFVTTSGIIVGYAYFLITSRDPTYQDFMKRLFLSRRKKLMKKHNFDVERFMELQNKCKSPLDAPPSAKHVLAGLELET